MNKHLVGTHFCYLRLHWLGQMGYPNVVHVHLSIVEWRDLQGVRLTQTRGKRQETIIHIVTGRAWPAHAVWLACNGLHITCMTLISAATLSSTLPCCVRRVRHCLVDVQEAVYIYFLDIIEGSSGAARTGLCHACVCSGCSAVLRCCIFCWLQKLGYASGM